MIDAVYNKAPITVIILDNRTTGMTGHQNHPATGKTIKNEPTYELDLAEVCRAVGAPNVRTVDPGDLGEMERAVKEELAKDEVSVIIAKKPCVLLTKKLYNGFRVNGLKVRVSGDRQWQGWYYHRCFSLYRMWSVQRSM